MELFGIFIIIIFVVYILIKSNPALKNKSKQKVNTKSSLNSQTDFNENDMKAMGLTKKDMKEADIDYKAKHTIYEKNPEAKGIPELVKLGRNLHKGKTLYELSKLYFSTLPSFVEDNILESNNIINNFDNCFTLIEPFILCEKKTWNSFDIKKIPLIENALLYYSISGNNGKLNEAYILIKYFPELDMYLTEANNSIKFCTILPLLLKYIKENNGVKISDLKEIYSDDYELIKSKMYYLGKYGILRVTKKGNSNFYEVV